MNARGEFDPPTVVGYRPASAPDSGIATLEIVPERLAITPPKPRTTVVRPEPVAPVSKPQPHDGLIVPAAPLLTLIARLSAGVARADVPKLRSEVIERIHTFDKVAERTGMPPAQVRSARYVLCAAIDEAVMTASWGHASDWSTNSLLNRFHGETWGGENVFSILDRAKAEPVSNLPLLRLIEHVLLLGFEGMHRVREDGRERLEILREDLRHVITRHLAAPPAELSRDWRGTGADGTLRSYLPLWIVFAVAGLLMVCIYSYQRYRLALEAAPVVAQMRALERGAEPAGARP